MSYIDGAFDRRTFNPEIHALHRKTLNVLRQIGRSRAWHCLNGIRYPSWPTEQRHESDHIWCCGSNALKALWQGLQGKRNKEGVEVYIDIGCGDSPDAYIAALSGFESFGVDLFPPSPDSDMANVVSCAANSSFIRADALLLPFKDYAADYISSQAMIALVKPQERLGLYEEIHRVLKIGGTFSLTGAELKCGYGWKQSEEIARARKIPSWEIESGLNGFCATRLEDGAKPQTPYSRRLYRSYVFYSTPQECAIAAAAVFAAMNWRWSNSARGRRSYIPSETELYDDLVQLSIHEQGCESGRLCYYDGKFGHQRPR